MRKVFPKIALIFVIISAIISALSVCVIPIDIETLLENDTVKEIIKNDKGSVTLEPEFEIEDKKPELSYRYEGDTVTHTLAELPEEENITIFKNKTPKSVEITVTNADEYVGKDENGDDIVEIEWCCGPTGTLELLEVGDTFTVDTADSSFSEQKTYIISVIGTISGEPYCTLFNIVVE